MAVKKQKKANVGISRCRLIRIGYVSTLNISQKFVYLEYYGTSKHFVKFPGQRNHFRAGFSTYLNRTLISFELISFAVEFMTPPNRPPPLRPPRPPPIMSAERRIINMRKPMINKVGRRPDKLDASISDLYITGTLLTGSMPKSAWAFSKFRSNESTLPMVNQSTPCAQIRMEH